MAKNIDEHIGNVMTTISFQDSSGNLVGQLKINLQDEQLIGKLGAFAEDFRAFRVNGNRKEQTENLKKHTIQAFNKLLGYSCEESLFGVLGPSAILETGETYAGHIIRTLSRAFVVESKKRAAVQLAAMQKYTAKYENERV